MLPQITLSGSGGSQALSGGDLFSAGSGVWSLGLNLTQPLFHGGELLHKKRAAQAGLDKAEADWQQTVLTAFQNVADSLQALQYDAQTLAAQATAESAASQRLELTRQQYQLGATGYLDLLDAERSLPAGAHHPDPGARRTAVRHRGAVYRARRRLASDDANPAARSTASPASTASN